MDIKQIKIDKIKEFECVNCKKKWLDYVSNDRNKRFCSVKCKSENSRIERVCEECGKYFSICKSVLKTNATGRFCSRKCYVDSMTTGLTRNKDGFRTISNKIREKHPFCAICGKFSKIHIHHINAYKYSKDNSKENLIPLCISHHKVVEHQTEKLLEILPSIQVIEMMTNILRSRQLQTFSFIKTCKSLI